MASDNPMNLSICTYLHTHTVYSFTYHMYIISTYVCTYTHIRMYMALGNIMVSTAKNHYKYVLCGSTHCMYICKVRTYVKYVCAIRQYEGANIPAKFT